MSIYFEAAGWANKEEWHVGEPIPAWVKQIRVLKVQADGHELTALLEALESK